MVISDESTPSEQKVQFKKGGYLNSEGPANVTLMSFRTKYINTQMMADTNQPKEKNKVPSNLVKS